MDSNSYPYECYDILRIVFQYLNARDLGSAAMVCRSWSEAADHEKSSRGPCCFTLHTRSDIYNIQNIRIKPSAGFFFIHTKFYSFDEANSDIKNLLQLLPENFEAVRLYGRGTILDNDEVLNSYHEFPRNPFIVCAFLPQIPNVRIKSFELAKDCVIQNTPEYQEIIRTIVDETSNHETSTCFMLFCNYFGKRTAERWASVMQESKQVKIASVWGGVLVRLGDIYVQRITKERPRNAVPNEPYCVAVLITGPIKTWSIILDIDYDTIEQIEARLKLFKDEVKLKKHSIGFMFGCVFRKMYRIRDQYNNGVSTIFKRLFPKVPLTGCFGIGAFGKTTTVDEVNEEKNAEEEHKYEKSKPWYENPEGSTVFLILTYG